MKRSTLIVAILAGFVAVTLAPNNAFAIPAFSRKHDVACSFCHVAMPYLNHTGREFKEAGYLMPDASGDIDIESQPAHKISDSLIFGKFFPMSARIKGYVVDKKKHKDTKIRPLHEIEILSAGNFWKQGSWFFEAEAEDEAGFVPEIVGWFAWHPSRAANIAAGVGNVFTTDPYNSLADGGHRLTVAHKLPLDTGKSVGLRLRKDTQFIGFYGRAGGKFFYELSFSAGNGNDEGENPKDYLARFAFDFTDELSAGGFYFGGTHTLDEGDVDLTRFGIDFNLAFGDVNLLGMAMKSDDDFGGFTDSNTSAYLEFFYAMQKDDRPFFVPLLRYEWTEVNDGNDKQADIVAHFGIYPIENVQLALEYWKEVDVPGDDEKIDRFTLLADVIF